MQLYVQTKDRSVDYPLIKWLPQIPTYIESSFFNVGISVKIGASVHPYHDLVRPGIFLKSDGEAWKMLVSGVNSGRRDYTNAQIMCTFVITGKKDEGAQIMGFLEKFVTEVLCDITPSERGIGTSETLVQVLLKHLPQGCPSQLSNRYYKENGSIDDAVNALLYDLSAITPQDIYRTFYTEPFYGGTRDITSQKAFLALCERLLQGERGTALSLYYLTSNDVQTLSTTGTLSVLRNNELAGILLNDTSCDRGYNKMPSILPAAIKKPEKDGKFKSNHSLSAKDLPKYTKQSGYSRVRGTMSGVCKGCARVLKHIANELDNVADIIDAVNGRKE